LNDAELIVRAKAYQILQGVESEKAQQAISQRILLNPGDRNLFLLIHNLTSSISK
jgi:hypothetical protein